MTERTRDTAQRRDDILGAARALMRETGDSGFSMRTLARQARVSIATPYHMFGSKRSILLAVLDADLAEFQRELAGMCADEIGVLFEAGNLMSQVFAREPEFYRNVLGAVLQGGPELRVMVGPPRYLLWKRLLRQATDAGLLNPDVDPDAFAIATSQLLLGNVLEWAQGALTLDEMAARNEYGLALTLLAIATDASRPHLVERMRGAEARLQKHWRTALMARLRQGELDDETRELVADQLERMNSNRDEEHAP